MGGDVTVKQTVRLFIRALIIGVLINISLQQISNITLFQHQTVSPQQAQDQTKIIFSDPSKK